MKVAVAGASGFVGRALLLRLSSGGDDPVRLVRRGGNGDGQSIRWDPSSEELAPGLLDGVGGVVCLSGETIAGRWTSKKKKSIMDSRVQAVSLLAREMASMRRPPEVFVCASAVGYYGNRNAEPLDETSTRGEGFLADVCEAWESALNPAREAGVRTVSVRLGVVLDPSGGLLRQVLPLFKAGLGGPLGRGDQFMSWIGLDDTVRIFEYSLHNGEIEGAVNGTSPNPVTNAEFTTALARALHRPALLHVPAFAIKLALGQAGQSLALESTRALPVRLQSAGFTFDHPDLATALQGMLARD